MSSFKSDHFQLENGKGLLFQRCEGGVKLNEGENWYAAQALQQRHQLLELLHANSHTDHCIAFTARRVEDWNGFFQTLEYNMSSVCLFDLFEIETLTSKTTEKIYPKTLNIN